MAPATLSSSRVAGRWLADAEQRAAARVATKWKSQMDRAMWSVRQEGFHCDTMVSAAWVSPRGKVVGLASQTHAQWADKWLERADPRLYAELRAGLQEGTLREHHTPIHEAMFDKGWVQVFSMREIRVPQNPSPEAMEATAEILADCLAEKATDPESHRITIWRGRDQSKMTAGDFIRKHGGRALEDELYTYLYEQAY